ncbi:MAG: ribbon-helix-helix domain-containing protein [Acidimicrobiales bacterium]
MRTTLTIEDDVAASIERLRRERNMTLKELANQALREGLAHMDKPRSQRNGPFTRPIDLGRPLMELTDIAEVLAAGEGENFK